jgi:hypothetical protein
MARFHLLPTAEVGVGSSVLEFRDLYRATLTENDSSEGPREFPPTPIVHPFQPEKLPRPLHIPQNPITPKPPS